MFDFHKSDLAPCFKEKLLDNSFLEFQTRFNRTTGEEHFKSIAYYRGIKFTIYNINSLNSRITIEGSFHKYWNDGKHNFNNFSEKDLFWVLGDIERKFQISPSDCQVKQLEVGLNIRPPYETKKILQSCLLHKTKPFKWVFVGDEGNYIQAYHNNYIVKIYDKQKHYQLQGYNIPMPIMRFELKFKRQHLNTILNKSGIITLENILDFEIGNFKTILLKEWNNVLFYDFTTLNYTQYKERYSNPIFWTQLEKSNFKYHRNNLNKITSENPSNLKEEITEIMFEKIDSLLIKTVRIKPLYIA